MVGGARVFSGFCGSGDGRMRRELRGRGLFR
jgi:hypothetical protein